MNSAAVNRYQQNDVVNMSPARQVVFLYGHVLASLRQASRHIAQPDAAARTRSLTKSREILGELLCTLDFDAGPIANNLAGLYAWFMDETVQIDATRDAARLTRLIGLVAELHSAWDQAAAQMADAPAIAVG